MRRRPWIIAAIVVLAVVLLGAAELMWLRQSSRPPTAHASPSPSVTASPTPSPPPTEAPAAAGWRVVAREFDASCASNGRHLAPKCPVRAFLVAEGNRPTTEVVLRLQTSKYVSSSSPPFTVSLVPGPYAFCVVGVPATSAGKQAQAACTLKPPSGYGFAVSSASALQVAIKAA